MTLAERQELAAGVLAATDRLAPRTVRLAGHALRLEGGPLAGVGAALEIHGQAREDGEPSRLAVMKMALELRVLARDEELVRGLRGRRSQPWRALAAALVAVRESERSS